jgi:DNA-binding NtrC family response regulator
VESEATARATALVIDDEAPIRHLVQRMLEPEVCRVLQAPDAESGLRLIERADPPVDVVLTDWIMRGLDGLDVLEVLHRHRPELQVAVISGYTSTIHTVIHSARGLQVLQKPFTAVELGQAVTEMLACAAEIRQRARETRARAARARDQSARLREQSAAVAAKVDLVAAAWEIHRARGAGEFGWALGPPE